MEELGYYGQDAGSLWVSVFLLIKLVTVTLKGCCKVDEIIYVKCLTAHSRYPIPGSSYIV